MQGWSKQNQEQKKDEPMSAISGEFAKDLKEACRSHIKWYGERIIRNERARYIITVIHGHAGDMVGELTTGKVFEFCHDLPMSYINGESDGMNKLTDWQILADTIEAWLNTPEVAAAYNRYCRVYDSVCAKLLQMTNIPQEVTFCNVPYWCSKVRATTSWYCVCIPNIADFYANTDADATDGYELTGDLHSVALEIANDIIRRNPEIEL